MVKKPSSSDVAELDAPEVLAAPVLKWASWPGNTGMTSGTSVPVGNISGTGTGGQAPGAVAVGDLLIVTVTAGLAGGIADYTISGSGWTQILNATAGDREIKTFVWWKIATSADVTAAGQYTVTVGSTSVEAYLWAEWNFGQNAFVDAWSGLWSNVLTSTTALNPSCSPTGAADTLLTYWANFHVATNWTLPSGFTSVFSNTQGGLPSQAGSFTKTLAAAGPTGNVTSTIGASQQYGAFQIAISTGSPPSGGGGASPIKWMSAMATQPAIALGTSVVVGTGSPAATLGPFAANDLYVVACTVEADTGPPGTLSISGTGWTNLVATGTGAPLNTRLSVWGKLVGSGETGVYTISWPNATGNPNWTVWNYGQATLDVAAGICQAPSGTALAAPSITTTHANETVLAYWFLVDTTAPGLGIPSPALTGFVPRATNLQGTNKWDMTTGDYPQAAAGATGTKTATANATGMPVYSAFQLGIIPGSGVAPPPTSPFPAFMPVLPPPLIGSGGSPSSAIVIPAPVPPSVAGIALIRFSYGSATTPPASAAFPEFTTTFPVPTVVFSNILTVPTFAGGLWTSTLPAYTTTTPPLGGSYNTGGVWGPPIGPALPVVVPPSRPFMVATNGNLDDVVEVQTAAGSEPNGNGEVYDDSDEENEDWVEETPHRTPPKPRGRGRRK